MKKFLFVLFGIIFTTTSAFALINHYKTFKAGKYSCPEADGKTCVIHKYKTGDISFEADCLEVEASQVSKYAPMIKRGQCKYSEDKNKYYICEFADAKCEVMILATNTKINCTSRKAVQLSPLEQQALNKKILNFAKEGKCRDMYPKESETSSNKP